MRARDWRTPTNWDERFREALTVLCGEPPPAGFVEGWFQPGADDDRLQEWASDKCRMPWAQGIVVIDAAEMLANDPAEGGMHADRRQPGATSGAPPGCYPEEWGISSERQLTCACGNADPRHWETK